jgi:arylsulfatase A-like enzyme
MSNILIITVDSLRADHIGCYGYDRETTPNVDALADGAAVYENAFAHACSTRPSFPALLTSSYPLMYGGYERLSENRTVISEVFDDAGYRTGGFHSNAYLNPEFGYARGFDEFYDSMSDTDSVARLRHWVKNRLNQDGIVYKSLASAFDTAERTAGVNIGSAYVDADEITDRAVEFVRRGSGDEEFLWVHYMDVHHPYLPPADAQRAIRGDPISERRAIQLRRKFMEDPEAVTAAELDDIIDLYDATIRFTDEQIGRLLEAADRHWGDYTVAFTADHGEEFKEHGEFSHFAKFYDEVMHVPLIVDDGEHGGRHEELVGLVDLAPTLAEAAGLDRPDNWYGHSLERLHEGEWPRESVLGDWSPDGQGHEDRRYAYRDREWKFIDRPEGEELYYLPDDPDEQENVVETAGDVVETLRAAVDDHERTIDETREDLGTVEMDEEVKDRLRDLGYKE